MLQFLKSETRNDIISNAALAGPNVYCVKMHNEDIKKTLKGIPPNDLRKNFDMIVYRKCVENNLIPRTKVIAIRSLKDDNYTVRVEKCHISYIGQSL